MASLQRIVGDFIASGGASTMEEDRSRLVALMTGILVLVAGMGGALIFIAMVCLKKKMKKYARRRLLRRDSSLSFTAHSQQLAAEVVEVGDEMWTPLPEEALKRRRLEVILQPVHAEQDDANAAANIPLHDDEDADAGDETLAEDDVPVVPEEEEEAEVEEEEEERGEDEDRSAYRLCYNDLDMYRSDEDQTADEGSGYLDEEEGYMHELEQWSEEFLLSEMGGSSSTSDLHRLTQPLAPGTHSYLFIYLLTKHKINH
jgi:hypothetical protein